MNFGSPFPPPTDTAGPLGSTEPPQAQGTWRPPGVGFQGF